MYSYQGSVKEVLCTPIRVYLKKERMKSSESLREDLDLRKRFSTVLATCQIALQKKLEL